MWECKFFKGGAVVSMTLDVDPGDVAGKIPGIGFYDADKVCLGLFAAKGSGGVIAMSYNFFIVAVEGL